ncbi:MAG: DsrE family protein [Actinomycetota bacterium]|nr:DsrE family protein [Actinomycetota bacterium]
MASIMVHITNGPENPTRAALGLLVARTATEDGHDVTVFLAGDAVLLMSARVREAVTGVGLGNAREHFDAIVAGGGRFYVSKMSSGARGIGDADLEGMPAEMARPTDLVRLAVENDRMFTY